MRSGFAEGGAGALDWVRVWPEPPFLTWCCWELGPRLNNILVSEEAVVVVVGMPKSSVVSLLRPKIAALRFVLAVPVRGAEFAPCYPPWIPAKLACVGVPPLPYLRLLERPDDWPRWP